MTEQNQYALTGNAAERYERNMVPAIFEPFARDLVELAELHEGENVLDVACGTGIVARLAWLKVGSSGRVLGMDRNSEMLAVARRVASQLGAEIEWVEGDAADIPVPGSRFDVVACQHGLQYFSDRLAALKEMRRTLRPGGRLVLNVWRQIKFNPGHAVFADVLERLVSAEAAATRRAPMRFSDREELRETVGDAGFEDVMVRLSSGVARFDSAEAMISIMIAGTPLGTALQDAEPNKLDAVINETGAGLREYLDDFGLAIPMQAWVATARS